MLLFNDFQIFYTGQDSPMCSSFIGFAFDKDVKAAAASVSCFCKALAGVGMEEVTCICEVTPLEFTGNFLVFSG